MKDRSITLGVGAMLAGALAVSVTLYSTAHAQTATAAPPAAGPRGIAVTQDGPRPPSPQFGQQFAGGGEGSIAADQGIVYVLRGNAVIVLTRDTQTGRLRVTDRVELPGGRGPNNVAQPIRPEARPGGGATAVPPPSK